MLRFAVWIFVGYLVGMFFSDHIFADISLTHWSNLWVYFWLLFWPLGALVKIGMWALLVALVIAVVVLLYEWQKEIRS